MSGDVGRSCASRPGYMGYMPSGQVKAPDVTTVLNNKLPLGERMVPSQRPKVDEASRTLDPSKASSFAKRGCVTSVYSTSTGVFHGEPPRTVASIKSHGPLAATMPPGPTQYETSHSSLSHGYAKVSKQNFMTELRTKEQAANEQSQSLTGTTRSSARATLPSIRMQAVRKECVQSRPSIDFARLVRRGPTLSVKGVAENCPDVRMFNDAPTSTYAEEVNKGRVVATRPKQHPGYQGHYPQQTVNLHKMKNDTALVDNKGNVLASAPCRAMPGYGGHIPTSTYNDRGREGLKPTLADTTAGIKSSHVRLDEFNETKMNVVLNGKSSAVRKFFTPGPYADNSISDQFYLRYRPLEGFMKSGPATSTQWISDQDLRTNVL